jgi:hypothetical protein
MNISFVMAVYDDFYGVAPTLASFKIHHRSPQGEGDEIIVADNHPDARQNTHGGDTKVTVEMMGGKYLPLPAPVGTAFPRDVAIRSAKNEIVICCDPHVLFVNGAIDAVRNYFSTRPNCKDIVNGPMLYDNWTMTTHFRDEWNGMMRGRWDLAWVTPDGSMCSTRNHNGKVMRCDLVTSKDTGETYDIPFQGADGYLIQMGWRPAVPIEGVRFNDGKVMQANPNISPYEVPGCGLGAFAFMKANWPGFNPNFRGFGGEEMYIHEKFRRQGGKAICLPQFVWWHRFGRPGCKCPRCSMDISGMPYPATYWGRVRNYVLAHRELGWPLDPVHRHFIECMNDDGTFLFRDQQGKQLKGPMSEDDWKKMIEADVPPETGPESNATCTGCTGGAAPADAPKSLEEWYNRAKDTSSDINEHVPTLRELASKCESVVEFGCRRGVSTVALLAGQPKRLTSYDISQSAEAIKLKELQGNCRFEFVLGDSRTAAVEPCSMAFIDSVHALSHITAELKNLEGKVSKYLVFHDSENPWGINGENNEPGVRPAIVQFLTAHKEWFVLKHYRNNHGLTVLSRVEEERPKVQPGIIRQGVNWIKAKARHALAGGRYLPLPIVQERLDTCTMCEHRANEQCSLCGCFIRQFPDNVPLEGGKPGKVWLPTESCPIGYWLARPNDGIEMTKEELAEAMDK